MSEFSRANERARAGAKKAGRWTYQHQVIDAWPGCVDCGQPIRGGAVDRYRRCGCPGRRWDHDYNWPVGDWRIVDPDLGRADAEEPTDA